MMRLIIVTGLSGSGKSIALRTLEDNGFYCIDNLPATLLPQLAHHVDGHSQERMAISIDSRSASVNALPEAIKALQSEEISVEVLFLEANTETIVKRFSETRRKHPLSDEKTTLAESITHERDLLNQLSDLGHHIDTSNLAANALRNIIKDYLAEAHEGSHKNGIVLLFTSFGFKYGIPLDADFVFDVRCLPNPHYDPELRPLTGRDAPIQDFLHNSPNVNEMLTDVRRFVERWLPNFNQDNRSYLTVAIGCTGGQHRSVYFVEMLAAYFKGQGQKTLIRHRELL